MMVTCPRQERTRDANLVLIKLSKFLCGSDMLNSVNFNDIFVFLASDPTRYPQLSAMEAT